MYDPNDGFQRGLQQSQLRLDRERVAMDQRKTQMAEQEAALRRQMHMERAVALEAMNKEIREELATNPSQNEEELRIKKISKYAPDLFGPEGAMSFYQQAPYRIAQARAANALAQSRENELANPKLTGPAADIAGLREAKRQAEEAGDKEGAEIYGKALNKASGQQSGMYATETNVNLLRGYIADAEKAKAAGDMKGYELNMRLARYLEGARNAPDEAVRRAKLSKLRILDRLLAEPLSMLSKEQRAVLESEREEIYSTLDEAEPFVPGVGVGAPKSSEPVWNYAPGRGLVK